jgi:hypothetical protein
MDDLSRKGVGREAQEESGGLKGERREERGERREERRETREERGEERRGEERLTLNST